MASTTTVTPVLSEDERRKVIALIQREVVPALGCTEPIAVALAVARATEALGEPREQPPKRVSVRLSANVLKNAMGVGIPGADGMVGLPIAIALGALTGRSELGLEVLRDVTPAAVAAGRKFIHERRVSLALVGDDVEDVGSDGEKLFIEAEVESVDGHRAKCVIAGGHTNIRFVSRDGVTVFGSADAAAAGDPATTKAAAERQQEEETVVLTMRKVYDFATTTPLEELLFISEARRLNKEAAEKALQGEYGHCVGKTMRCEKEKKIMGDSVFTHILCSTSAACDARMAGAPVAVMSNSGSGNQGIAATIPVVVYAEETHADEETTLRALVLSHLVVVYIKQSLGRLSALCGCVAAATGSSCGIVHLMGGGYLEVCSAAKNMIANLTGMLCDGAKPSCALKIASGVSTAVLSAIMAMEHRCVSAVEGIIDDDIDQTIQNLTRIGRDGMLETDRLVLEIMTSKDKSQDPQPLPTCC